MAEKTAKNIFKAVVLVYLISFFVINWSDVSWLFNYREVTGLVQDFFNPYPSIDANAMGRYFAPNQQLGSQIVQINSAPLAVYTDKQNTLEIPKINISVPIIFSASSDRDALTKDLDKGVVFYPGSVYPGQVGRMIILGHSAPLGWPKIKHDWVFTDLDKLIVGDKIMIDVNNQQYTYIVKQKTIIERGADVPSYDLASSTNVLTLISCWPPGKDYQRIAVTTELATS